MLTLAVQRGRQVTEIGSTFHIGHAQLSAKHTAIVNVEYTGGMGSKEIKIVTPQVVQRLRGR